MARIHCCVSHSNFTLEHIAKKMVSRTNIFIVPSIHKRGKPACKHQLAVLKNKINTTQSTNKPAIMQRR